MSEGPIVSMFARTKGRSRQSRMWWVFAVCLGAVLVVITSLAFLRQHSRTSYDTVPAMQASNPQKVHEQATPKLESVTKELQTVDKSLQQDLDTADLDRRIDNIVIE